MSCHVNGKRVDKPNRTLDLDRTVPHGHSSLFALRRECLMFPRGQPEPNITYQPCGQGGFSFLPQWNEGDYSICRRAARSSSGAERLARQEPADDAPMRDLELPFADAPRRDSIMPPQGSARSPGSDVHMLAPGRAGQWLVYPVPGPTCAR